MSYYTYILENIKGRLYIGQTSNLDLRLEWHNSGKSRYTKSKGPWKLLYKKEWENRSQAIKYEKYLKSLKNPRFIRNSIIGV